MTCSQFLGELQHRGKHLPLLKTSTETELSRLHSEKSHRSDRDVSSSFELVEDKLIRELSLCFLLQAVVFGIFASLE